LTLRLDWKPAALRELKRADRKMQERILSAMERLAATGQGDVKLLQGTSPREFRLRVGEWRVRFGRDDANSTLIVLHVFPRGRGYH
jgi:mRNA-degrading endonuclease RelE of RelBE toxin-antitoxin system